MLKTNVQALAEFLMDPHAARPSGRMPSLRLTSDEAVDIARYLLLGQAAGGSAETRGLAFEYFEDPFAQDYPDFDLLEAVDAGIIDRFRIDERRRDDHFGFRFSGSIEVPLAGEYTFHTTSDDGSRLSLGGELLVDNAGLHGMRERSQATWLEAGKHAILVTMYESGGGEGLLVHWSGPGFEKQEIPAQTTATASAAIALLLTTPPKPSSRRYAQFTRRYTTTTMTTPPTIASGTLRPGRRTSPAIHSACCHPPKEKSAGTSPAKTAPKIPTPTAAPTALPASWLSYVNWPRFARRHGRCYFPAVEEELDFAIA